MHEANKEGSSRSCLGSKESRIDDTGATERDCSEGYEGKVGKSPQAKDGFVYFIQTKSGDNQIVKIGFARNINRRLNELNLLLPFGFCLLGWFPGTTSSEAWVHARFDHIRVWGEWFHLTDELHRYIDVLGLIKPTATPEEVRQRASEWKHVTPRQRQVLDLRSAGLTQVQVAQRLGISQEAVRRLEDRAYWKAVSGSETLLHR